MCNGTQVYMLTGRVITNLYEPINARAFLSNVSGKRSVLRRMVAQ